MQQALLDSLTRGVRTLILLSLLLLPSFRARAATSCAQALFVPSELRGFILAYARSPDDLNTYNALADWLQEQSLLDAAAYVRLSKVLATNRRNPHADGLSAVRMQMHALRSSAQKEWMRSPYGVLVAPLGELFLPWMERAPAPIPTVLVNASNPIRLSGEQAELLVRLRLVGQRGENSAIRSSRFRSLLRNRKLSNLRFLELQGCTTDGLMNALDDSASRELLLSLHVEGGSVRAGWAALRFHYGYRMLRELTVREVAMAAPDWAAILAPRWQERRWRSLHLQCPLPFQVPAFLHAQVFAELEYWHESPTTLSWSEFQQQLPW